MLRSCWFWPAVIAVGAWVAVISALDPVGEYPRNGEGPGLTLDEQFNVQQGVMMVDHLLSLDGRGFREWVNKLPDHPLLGRLWLGLSHEMAYLVVPPAGPSPPAISMTLARSGSASAFALLVFLIGWFGSRWYGLRAGAIAALSVVLMPRVFGHAHLASLETCVNLTWCATVLCLADFADRDRPPAWWLILALGALFGLALLTKIQAVLLPLPLGLWMIYRWRVRGVVAAVAWGLVGVGVFFAGWPWLWSDPLRHAMRFLQSSSQRSAVSVWYFGAKFADRDVPWHYPWVLFLTTVPLGLHLLGLAGLRFGKSRSTEPSENGAVPLRDTVTSASGSSVNLNACHAAGYLPQFGPRELLLLSAILFPLIVFSVPGVAVYDGERLFLMVFPLWGLFVGRGVNQLAEFWGTRRPQWVLQVLLGCFLVLQSYGLWALAPCHLSYYNLLVGGLRGADRLGLQATYWGETMPRSFLRDVAEAVPPGSVVRFNPVMHSYQLPELQDRSVSLRQREVKLAAYNTDGNLHPPYLLVFLRKDSLPEEFHHLPKGAELAAVVKREGVMLAALYHFPQRPPFLPRESQRLRASGQ